MGIVLKELLANGARILADYGDVDAEIDSEILLLFALRYDKHKMFMNWSKEIDDFYCEKFFALIEERGKGVPTQYLTKQQEFYGLNLYVDERVLIPRQETEVLVEQVLIKIRDKKLSTKKLNILDIFTGSGAIGLALAKNLSEAKFVLSDFSDEALEVATKNSSRLGLERKVKIKKSNIFESLPNGRFSTKFDIITANPPYIKTSAIPTLMREVSEYEPRIALDGGEDGLDFYKKIAKKGWTFLKEGGMIFLELGSEQKEDIIKIFKEHEIYKQVDIVQDLAGLDRVAIIYI